MILSGAMLLVCWAAAQPDTSRNAPVEVEVYAVYATREDREERYFDPGLGPVEHAVSDLPFDTYKKIRVATVSAPVGKEASFQITNKYTLFVKPLSRLEDQARLELRVELAGRSPAEKPKTAIATTVVMSPSREIKLRGLKMDEGEMVVVLDLKLGRHG